MIASVVFLVVGCTGEQVVNKPTITQDQALARVEGLIKETAGAISPEPRMRLYPPSLNVNPCLDPTDGGSEKRVVINRSYYLDGISKDQVPEVAKQVRRYWEQQGHYIEVVSVNGLNISGRSKPDDFLLSLSPTGPENNVVLSLGVTSYCVWPNGTPEPSSSL